MTAKPPAMSPYSVAYPMAISLLLPVVNTIQPNLLEIVIRTLPRILACTFSSATLGWVFRKVDFSISAKAVCAGSMGTSHSSIPRLFANSWESLMLPSEEYREGIAMPTTFSGPRASTATVAVRAESTPPDSPIKALEKPVLPR